MGWGRGVSCRCFWRRCGIDGLAISRSLWTVVAYSTIIFILGGNLFSSRASKLARGTRWYHARSNVRNHKELNNEHCNVLPAAGVRDGPGAYGARSVHTTAAQDHRRADDPYSKTRRYCRASHENHTL